MFRRLYSFLMWYLMAAIMLLGSGTSYCVPYEEMSALHDLYTNTSGESWAWRENATLYGAIWNFTQSVESGQYLYNPCSDSATQLPWQGITCSNSTSISAYSNTTCHITTLDLAEYSLNGSLPETLDRLSELERLMLEKNAPDLRGPVPISLGNLAHLSILDLSDNFLTGSIPSTLCNLAKLEILFMQDNNLSGPLQEDVSRLVALRYLLLSDNLLQGPLPSALGTLLRLTYLSLQGNLFSDSIPSELGLLMELEALYLYNNHLDSSLPPELGNLVNVQAITINDNFLSGSIPPELGTLTQLIFFSMDNNLLSKSLPHEILQMKQLEFLLLQQNILTGNLPADLGLLTALKYLHVYDNTLTGPLPSLDGLGQLQSLALQNNGLTGSVPFLGKMVKLQFLYFYENQLTGTIPPLGLNELVNIKYFYFHENFISGSIPEIGNLTKLEYFAFYNNFLTGPLPELKQLIHLEYFYLSGNSLTGTLDSDIGQLIQLSFLDLHANDLTGSLPSTLGDLLNLEKLVLYSNHFAQNLPMELSQCTSLLVLQLQNNLISGTLDGIFVVNMLLENLDVSNNKLSGDIPQALFGIMTLETVALSVNCFKGELFPEMCAARNMSVLSLDGLGAARGCRHTVKAPITGVVLFNTLEGTIPECLWSLPLLQVLHLTGNGLTGSIGGYLAAKSSLATVSIAHNKISGTIPDFIQAKDFVHLDLSFNKLTGTYSRSNNGSFTFLEVNRLSGRFPSTNDLSSTEQLSAVRGNLFGCGYIPPQDDYSQEYTCGSEEFDVFLYTFLCLTAILILLVIFMKKKLFRKCCPEQLGVLFENQWLYVTYLRDSLCDSASPILMKICIFSQEMHSCAKLFLALFCVYFVTCFPLCGFKISEYGVAPAAHTTHAYQYRWLLSVAFMHGDTSFVLLLVMWISTVFTFRILTIRDGPLRRWVPWDTRRRCARERVHSDTGSVQTEVTIDGHNDPEHTHWSITKALGVLLLNSLIVGGIDSMYILAFSQSLPSTSLVTLQIVVAVFKVSWNMVVVPLLARQMKAAAKIITMEMMLLILNAIILPCIATALTSPSCFQGLLVDSEEVTSSYDYSYCKTRLVYSTDGSSECTLYATQDVTVAPLQPPFSYNNMCSSTLVTTFVPVYMFVYSIEVLIPMLYLFFFTYLDYSQFSRHLKISFLHGIFWPEYWNFEGENPAGATASTLSMEGSDDNAEPRKLLKANRIVTSDILNNLLVFFTFGMCSPFLALIMLLSVAMKHIMWITILGRFVYARILLTQAHHHGSKDHALVALSDACLPVCELVASFVWPIIWCSGLFFAFLCWDVFGDEVEWTKALLAPAMVLAVPVCLWGGMKVFSSRDVDNSRDGEEDRDIRATAASIPRRDRSSEHNSQERDVSFKSSVEEGIRGSVAPPSFDSTIYSTADGFINPLLAGGSSTYEKDTEMRMSNTSHNC